MLSKSSRILSSLAIGVLILAAGCSVGGQKTVARVGEEVITEGEFRDSLKRLIPQGDATSKEDLAEIKKDLLNQLIEEKLLLAEAKKAGITVSDSELSSEVEGMKKEYADPSFKDAIVERYGNLDNWKDEIRKKLLMRKTVEKLIGSKSAVTEEAAREYYSEHSDEFRTTERVRARMIVVAAEDEARKIRGTLTAANFAETAQKASLSPDKETGGDLGFFSRGDMPAAFEDAVFKLKPGEISPVIKTEYGYHIFLLEERKKGGKLTFAEVKGKIMDKLKSEKEDSEFHEWIASLKKTTRIEIREDQL